MLPTKEDENINMSDKCQYCSVLRMPWTNMEKEKPGGLGLCSGPYPSILVVNKNSENTRMSGNKEFKMDV